MKCDDCVSLLEEYIDGVLVEHEADRVRSHLITCAGCASEFEALTAEQEIYLRYDRELNVSPAMWHAIAARTAAESRAVDSGSRSSLREWFSGLFAVPRFGYAFSGALVVSIFAVVFGLMYLRRPQQPANTPSAGTQETVPGNAPVNAGGVPTGIKPDEPPSPVNQEVVTGPKPGQPSWIGNPPDDPGVLYEPVAYSELTERDTAEHIKQAENLLRSIRSLQASDDNGEIDVSYEKAMSQRLLNENEVLRRDAEVAGKFPTKELLKDLEPFLIDIANLPDKTTPDKLRAIKDRAQKTEIVAALVSY